MGIAARCTIFNDRNREYGMGIRLAEFIDDYFNAGRSVAEFESALEAQTQFNEFPLANIVNFYKDARKNNAVLIVYSGSTELVAVN